MDLVYLKMNIIIIVTRFSTWHEIILAKGSLVVLNPYGYYKISGTTVFFKLENNCSVIMLLLC